MDPNELKIYLYKDIIIRINDLIPNELREIMAFTLITGKSPKQFMNDVFGGKYA